MSAKSQVDLSAEQVAVVSGQTTPESISPVTLGQMLQDIIDSMYNIIDTPLNRTQAFANAAARAAATPDFTGQVGIQIDTRTIYTSYGVVAGNWKLPANTQDQSDTYAVAGGTDAYTIALTPALTAYGSGNSFRVKFTNANTGAATLQEGALAAKSIKKNGSADLIAGDILAGAIYTLTFDGVNFQIDNSGYTAGGNKVFPLYKSYVDVGNAGTAETDIFTFTIPANTLAVNGENIKARAFGKAAASIGGASRLFKAYFGGTTLMTLNSNLAANHIIFNDFDIIRVSNTVIRVVCRYRNDTDGDRYFYNEITGLNLTTTPYTFRVTFTGDASNEVINRFAYVEYIKN